jgi:hypothetical protein
MNVFENLDILRKQVNARPVDRRGIVIGTGSAAAPDEYVDVHADALGVVTTSIGDSPSQITFAATSTTAASVNHEAQCWFIRRFLSSTEVATKFLPGALTSVDPREVESGITFVIHHVGSLPDPSIRIALLQTARIVWESASATVESRQVAESQQVLAAKQRWAAGLRSRVTAMDAALSLVPEQDEPTPSTDDD